MVHVIKIIGAADGTKTPADGLYLRDMDFDMFRGLGCLDATTLVGAAKRFNSFVEATEFWKTQSKVKPLRADGNLIVR